MMVHYNKLNIKNFAKYQLKTNECMFVNVRYIYTYAVYSFWFFIQNSRMFLSATEHIAPYLDQKSENAKLGHQHRFLLTSL